MIDYAQKYPFLFTLPPLISGVIIGSQIDIDCRFSALFCCVIILSMVAIRKFCSTNALLIIYPPIIIFIGIIASQTDPGNLLNLAKVTSLNISHISADIREWLIAKNQSIIKDETNCALSNAITLGYRQQLPSQIKTLFNRCGVMHIVAVSGLHVGVIYLMITKCLSYLKIPNRTRKIFAIILIWAYTFIVGMPQSVIRASAILTYITIAENGNKSYSSLNGIFACAFITTLISPQSIKQVSFQLSYAAYIGIATLFPLFSPAKKGGNKYLQKVIASIAISVAAQLSTMPITLHYFHGASTNSFILNLIVIPLLSILLYSNIFALILPWPLSIILGEVTNFTCSLIINVTRLLEPMNIYIGDININPASMVVYYLAIFLIFYTLSAKRRVL